MRLLVETERGTAFRLLPRTERDMSGALRLLVERGLHLLAANRGMDNTFFLLVDVDALAARFVESAVDWVEWTPAFNSIDGELTVRRVLRERLGA